jgi:elongation factor G
MTKASPVLIEPMMKVEIVTSEEFTGDIMSDLSQRRGKPQGMDVQDGTQTIKAVVPMAEMLDYATALRSMTQGRASFTMTYSHYEELPKLVQDKVIRDYEREKAEA